MSEWVKIEPDPEILSRITEREIMKWMVARLAALRADTHLPVHHMEIAVWYRQFDECYYDACWTLLAPDICALSCPSVDAALAEVRKSFLGNPIERAAEKRRQARDLLKEAEQIEAAAEQAA